MTAQEPLADLDKLLQAATTVLADIPINPNPTKETR